MRRSRFSPLRTFDRLKQGLVLAAALLGLSGKAEAAPEAHILRIDPRTAQQNGSPVLTTVIEVVQNKRVTEAVAPCAAYTGNAQLDCVASAMEKPYALYSPFPFPEKNAVFTVNVDGADMPGEFLSKAQWGDSQREPGVGTAWLILVDADARMGRSLDEAQNLAEQFIASMGPNDIVNVMFFNDRQVVMDSKWLPAAQAAKAKEFVHSVSSPYPTQGRNRSLMTILKSAATDGFKALGNVGEGIDVPLHQAMVVLSSGFGGTDPSSTGPGAMQVQQYMTGGRFPEDNTALPKAPVPVISVYFPHQTFDEFRQNSQEFMQNLANPEIGGFFTVMRDGEGARATSVVNAVRTRFSKMYVVKWRVSCVAPAVTQTFRLVFNNVKPEILGDNTFKDVPVGIDPTTWPLDVNVQYTQDSAKRAGGVYPGGKVKVYGNFCWGSDSKRAEVYFLPAGQQLPTALAGADLNQARRTQQQLIEMGMRGQSLDATDTFAEFQVPDNEKILHGSGEQAVVRLVIYDSQAHRTSGVTADSIVQLKGTKAPFPLLWVLGGAFGLVIVALLLVIILRSGSGKKGPAVPPPAPVVAGPVPGAPYAGAAPANPAFMYGGAPQVPAPAAGQGAPANPYGTACSRATLQGPAGVFIVVPGAEMHAGRDGAQCAILLADPSVSSLHASFKIEAGQLMLRDHQSQNGTLLNGNPLPAGQWQPVPNGSLVRLGRVELSVRLD